MESADTPAELGRAARALRALERPYEANAAYRDATSMAPRDVALNTAWGDLFLEKFLNGEASKSYQAALRLDARYSPALLGMAKALANDNPPFKNMRTSSRCGGTVIQRGKSLDRKLQ